MLVCNKNTITNNLADLKSKIDAFDELIARPRILIVERKTANQHIIPCVAFGIA